MEDLLIRAGLSQAQAQTYLFLLENGESTPPTLAKSLGITRTNAYKVLDSLEEIGLVHKSDVSKKLTYKAAEPSALASIVAAQRDRVITLEHNINDAMQQLRRTYRTGQAVSKISKEEGKAAMVRAYEHQAELRKPIYLIKSRADIPFMGFEEIHRIRYLGNKYGTKRFGITPDAPENPAGPNIDSKSNFTRTWIPTEDYTAPVEWTLCGDELLIEVFEGTGRVIRIQDQEVVDSFKELWNYIDKQARSVKGYRAYSPSAIRKLASN